ncbi:heme-binding protein soul4 isoform X1 [Dicentrarchus labrax]|uniref:heme-binding protein soul4 isoform X1 n=1 Tax=Dicentrarchus labrax TaxID=13489 RepID=UPI0021F63DEC|nr:heme-binding protein soul4 isoform X1 [Dicentrarchus labrax]
METDILLEPLVDGRGTAGGGASTLNRCVCVCFRNDKPPPAAMALISLEDLDGLDDEQLDDDITDNPEPMDEDDRLLSHWQAVASTHQVSVPPEMNGPIQEMTRNSQQREPLPFATVSRHEKMGELLYEERLYSAGNWACVTRGEDLYEQSISMGFMKLMRFICNENSAGRYLGMTVPVISNIHMMEDGNTFEKDVQTAFFLPAEYQTNPPRPSDPDITIVHREPIRVVARTFFGTTTEETVTHQIGLLWEILGVTDELHRDEYMVAVYENPGVPRRRNEIWFIRRNL